MPAQKPRLLVLTSTYPRWANDGEPAFVHELCRRLAAHYEILVIAPHAPSAQTHEVLDGVTVRRYRYLPHNWERLAYEGGIPAKLRRNPLLLLQVPFLVGALIFTVMRECIARPVDVIHAHWILPQGLVGALAGCFMRLPAVVCTAHGADLYALNLWPLRWLKSWTLRHVAVLTVVSRAMVAPAAVLGARPDSIPVAPMGVDVSKRFIPPERAARQDHLVLFAGRLVEKKGVRHLLEAFRVVHESREEARLVIAGDGPERGELEGLVRRHRMDGYVTFIGALPQTELAAYYRSAAVAAFPFVVAAGGDQEGLGLVTVEAQACACPVIASDLPALHDTIEDGLTGILVPPGSSADLARAILRVLSDRTLAEKLGAEGRRAAVKRFNWERVSTQYREILDRART